MNLTMTRRWLLEQMLRPDIGWYLREKRNFQKSMVIRPCHKNVARLTPFIPTLVKVLAETDRFL